MRNHIVRILLWLVVFVLPAVSAGFALPYGPYVLVPALVATDGVSARKMSFWLVLTFLYELLYRVPIGVLVVPILCLALIHAAIVSLIQFGSTRNVDYIGSGFVVRTIGVALLWAVGMVMLSAVWSALVLGGPSFSPTMLKLVWLQARTGGLALAAILISLVALRVVRPHHGQILSIGG
jgi:hypothetical protein